MNVSTTLSSHSISVPFAAISENMTVAEALEAFKESPEIPLNQSWLPQTEAGFLPGCVRVVQDGSSLHVLAVLHSSAFVGHSCPINEMFFTHSDAFEIFLRPENQDAYYEFHVGTANQKLQLRIPSAEAFVHTSNSERGAWAIPEARFKSSSHLDRENGLWYVQATIPFNSVVETGGSTEQWCFSFARYDYAAAGAAPVLSATSPYSKLNFHRQEEWNSMRFS